MTKNPNPSWGTDYFPVSNTVAGWGQPEWIPFGAMTHSIEYPQTTGALESAWTFIDTSVVQTMMTQSLDGGLWSFYNWQAFLVPFYMD